MKITGIIRSRLIPNELLNSRNLLWSYHTGHKGRSNRINLPFPHSFLAKSSVVLEEAKTGHFAAD